MEFYFIQGEPAIQVFIKYWDSVVVHNRSCPVIAGTEVFLKKLNQAILLQNSKEDSKIWLEMDVLYKCLTNAYSIYHDLFTSTLNLCYKERNYFQIFNWCYSFYMMSYCTRNVSGGENMK